MRKLKYIDLENRNQCAIIEKISKKERKKNKRQKYALLIIFVYVLYNPQEKILN